MPISEEEGAVLVERLQSVLRSNKLAWVAEQVEQQIADGKPAVRRVKELRYRRGTERATSDREGLEAAGREVEFRTTVRYSHAERVQLLAEAIRRSVVNTFEIEDVLSQQFHRVAFVSDDGGRQVTFSRDDISARTEAVARLSEALDRLLKEIG